MTFSHYNAVQNILNICFTCNMKKIACVWKTACVHVLGMLIKKNVWCKFSKNSSAVNSLLCDYFLLFPLYCKWKYPTKWKGKLYTVEPVFKCHPCGVLRPHRLLWYFWKSAIAHAIHAKNKSWCECQVHMNLYPKKVIFAVTYGQLTAYNLSKAVRSSPKDAP